MIYHLLSLPSLSPVISSLLFYIIARRYPVVDHLRRNRGRGLRIRERQVAAGPKEKAIVSERSRKAPDLPVAATHRLVCAYSEQKAFWGVCQFNFN